MRFTATRNASSAASPASARTADLLAQMVLQLLHVDGVDRLPAAEVAPPLVDLLLERYPVVRMQTSSDSLWQGRGPSGWPAEKGSKRPPDAAERRVHRLPLPALLGEPSPARGVIR